MAPTRHWLIKSEPTAYAYAQLVADGRTEWTGVRNFEARNNLRAMAVGDLCLYYHSVEEKAVVGVARVTRTARADATAREGDWVSVEVAPAEALPTPVTLERVKQDRTLADFPLLTRSRLSVAAVSDAHFAHVVALGRAPAPRASAGPRTPPDERRSRPARGATAGGARRSGPRASSSGPRSGKAASPARRGRASSRSRPGG